MTRSPWTCHTPGVIGDTGGRLAPSALSIGFENVSVMFVCGVITLPGAGLATAPALIPAGNQLTIAVGDVSHARGAAATVSVPAAAGRGRRMRSSGLWSTRRVRCCASGPNENVRTGCLNRSTIAAPAFSVRLCCLSDALGVMIVRLTVSVLPASHAFQPGRLTTTSMCTSVCALTVFVGQIWSPRSVTGIKLPSWPVVTLTLLTVPPPSGIPIRARAWLSGLRLAFADTKMSATTPAATTASRMIPPAMNGPRRNRRVLAVVERALPKDERSVVTAGFR